jgi:hypothetical protein
MTHGIDVNHEHFPGNYEQELPPNMQRLKQVSTQQLERDAAPIYLRVL